MQVAWVPEAQVWACRGQPLGLTLATWVAELPIASWQLAAQQSLSLAVLPNAYSHQPLISRAYPRASGQAESKEALRYPARKKRLREDALRRQMGSKMNRDSIHFSTPPVLALHVSSAPLRVRSGLGVHAPHFPAPGDCNSPQGSVRGQVWPQEGGQASPLKEQNY